MQGYITKSSGKLEKTKMKSLLPVVAYSTLSCERLVEVVGKQKV